jgi:hypothetical protein
MTNGLKTFWKDITNLSKADFGIKYLIPAIAAFMTFGTFGNFCMIKLDTDNLAKQTGPVNSIQVRFLQGLKPSYKYHPLWIQLDNYPDEFRLMDTYSKEFERLQSEIKVGDEITVYYRNAFLTVLGFGKTYDIFQINKGDKIVLSMDVIKDNYNHLVLIMGIAASILWALYYFLYTVRQRKKKHLTSQH